MTAMRVRENALARLLKDGKINGAGEILGLDRDPDRPGHFLVNHKELESVEKLFQLFIKLSSKKAMCDAATEMGIKWKDGAELNHHSLDMLFDNAKWRYRGQWFANKENEHVDPSLLPESKRFQTIQLPHGPLLSLDLLDAVEKKLADTYDKRKRQGKDGHIYLLSHVLVYEDGTKFTGQPAKNRQYHYYHNRHHKVRIHCEQIDDFVIAQVKEHFVNDQHFNEMLADAIRRRQTELPEVDRRITAVENEFADLERAGHDLRTQLSDPQMRGRVGFMDWLAQEVESLHVKKEHKETELEGLRRCREGIIRDSGLEDLRKAALSFIKGLDRLSGTEKRNVIGRMIKRVVLRAENQMTIEFYGEPAAGPRLVKLRKKSTDSDGDGSVRALWEG